MGVEHKRNPEVSGESLGKGACTTVLLALLSTLYTVTHHMFQSLALHGEVGRHSLGLDIEQTLTKYLQTEENEQKLIKSFQVSLVSGTARRVLFLGRTHEEAR